MMEVEVLESADAVAKRAAEIIAAAAREAVKARGVSAWRSAAGTRRG
jgi:hypothetical protein